MENNIIKLCVTAVYNRGELIKKAVRNEQLEISAYQK
jgi:hypothetical protein